MNYKRVEVEWIDSAVASGWHQELTAEMKNPLVCHTCGYLIHSDAETIVVALNRGSGGSAKPFGDAITIPRCAVLNIKDLRETSTDRPSPGEDR